MKAAPRRLMKSLGCAGTPGSAAAGVTNQKSDPEMAKRRPFWGRLKQGLRGGDTTTGQHADGADLRAFRVIGRVRPLGGRGSRLK
jgi:hypothetical protein